MVEIYFGFVNCEWDNKGRKGEYEICLSVFGL